MSKEPQEIGRRKTSEIEVLEIRNRINYYTLKNKAILFFWHKMAELGKSSPFLLLYVGKGGRKEGEVKSRQQR